VSHLTKSIEGVDVIRTFGIQKESIEIFSRLIDYNNVDKWAQLVVHTWFTVRIELLGTIK
jgi:hypothetical protein